MLFYLIHVCLINCSVQQENINTYLLQKESPFKYQKVENLDQKIQTHYVYGFGLWLKWQPILIQKIISPQIESTQQFIYSVFDKTSHQFIQIIYFENEQFKLGVLSEFYFVENIFTLISDFEGEWMFFDSLYDFQKKQITFHLYESATQQLKSYQIDQVTFFSNEIQYQIGGVVESCIIQKQIYQFSQYRGRLSIFFERYENLDEITFISYIKESYTKINDCKDRFQNILIENQLFTGDFCQMKNLGIIEKQQFQLNGWIKLIHDGFEGENYVLLRISNNINELLINQISAFYIIYTIAEYDVNTIFINSPDYSLPTGEINAQAFINQEVIPYFIFVQWHYIQVDIGYPKNKGTFRLFSNDLHSPISIEFDFRWYTGVEYYLFVGGDLFQETYIKGQIINLKFTGFCEVEERQFFYVCHFTCETCYGPLYNNCISCKSESRRILQNDQCQCQIETYEFQNNWICQSLKDIFPTLTIIEKELPCQLDGYDQCDNIIICSFGYFLYENQCIKCPNFDEFKTQGTLFCIDCYLQPNIFQQTLKCTTDLILNHQDQDYAFQKIVRNRDDFQIFYLIENNNILELQLNENLISYDYPEYECRVGYYYLDYQCLKCIEGCNQCDNQIVCQQCDLGFYKDLNNICIKCSDCLTCKLENYDIACLTCPQQYYLNQDSKCIQCGQFCSSCRENGYCNSCLDPQKYFISIDGVNCLPCTILNCKYCYQIQQHDQQFYTSFDINIGNQNLNEKAIYSQIFCAKCQQDYVLDMISNSCVSQDDNQILCFSGKYNQISDSFICLNELYIGINQKCQLTYYYCQLCLQDICVKCEPGYYQDFFSKKCLKCPLGCSECIQQNKIFQDFWRIELLPINNILQETLSQVHNFDDFLLSQIRADYEIICSNCNQGFILNETYCMEGCSQECQTCEIIKGQAKCTLCKNINGNIVRSLDQNGQCQDCQQNCDACEDVQIQFDPFQTKPYYNYFFNQTQENKKYTKLCYKSSKSQVDENLNIYLNQFHVVKCQQFQKCLLKVVINQNLYCDFKEFQKIDQDLGENYYIQDFFENNIYGKAKNQILIDYLNNNSIQEVDIVINLIQENNQVCYINSGSIRSQLIQNVFFLEAVNLKIIGYKQNVILENNALFFEGFQTITFEQINFLKGYINLSGYENCLEYEKSCITSNFILKNCEINGFQEFYAFQICNLFLENVKLELDNRGFHLFSILFRYENCVPQIKINNMKIINSKFYQSKIIQLESSESRNTINFEINQILIQQSEFNNTDFISFQILEYNGNKVFGNAKINQIFIDNFNLTNSILFSFPNFNSFNLKYLSIENANLYGSSIISSNLFNLEQISINNAKVEDSVLFFGSRLYNSELNYEYNLTFILIKNITYNKNFSIFMITDQEEFNSNINITEFQMSEVQQEVINQNLPKYNQTLIQINCYLCILNKITLERYNGQPEISITKSHSLIISDSFLTQNQNQASNLIKNCQIKVQNQLSYFIYIGQYQNVKIHNLTIINAISFNFPLIIIKGKDIIQKQYDESIEILNSKFLKNQLITSAINSPTSIIQIHTEQKCFINLNNLQFQENHLNIEYQDLITHSSSTLLIDTQLGKLLMNDCLFQLNIVTNSTDSSLYLKAQIVEIIYSKFMKNNILNYQNLFNRIQLNQMVDRINHYDLSQVIQVQSNGGSGFILTNQFSLKNCTVQESYSLNGGAFYVNTFGDAQILIENSTFIKTSSSLQSSATSYGGCFYIDAQVSKLTLLVKNSTFNQSYSRSKGGCFYIVPSNSFNFVYFEQINVINSFSTIGQFFDYSLQNLNKIISNVTFYKIQIFYDKIAFNKFLGLLDKLSDEEAFSIVNNGQIIMIKYGNLTINSILCQFEIKIFLAQIDQGQNINLMDIYVDKGLIWNSPFLSLNLKPGSQGLLNIQNLKIYNLQEYKEMKDPERCEDISIKNVLLNVCISPALINQNIMLENNIEKIQQNTLCQNENLIFQSEKNKFSLIIITNIQNNHEVLIWQIFFSLIDCNKCNFGLLNLQNIDQTQKNNIILKEINILKCQCGKTGCLSITNQYNETNFQVADTNDVKRILQQQHMSSLVFNFKFQVFLFQSEFIKNQADFGGALFIEGINILIEKCNFEFNSAKVGGAIYSTHNDTQILLLSTKIIENQAEKAGGLFLENQSIQETKRLNVIISDNNSTSFGQNIREKPRSLAISIGKEQIVLKKQLNFSSNKKIIEKTLIQSFKILGQKEKVDTLMFPSGSIIKKYSYFNLYNQANIPYNLSFRIIALNKLNQQEKQLENAICTIQQKVINLLNQEEIEDQYAQLSFYQIAFDTETQDFNLDDLIINFNPYYDKEIVLRLYIQCDMVQIPIYDENPPYLIKNLITDYTLFVDIKTFPCQLGEYFNSTSKICIQCDAEKSQYQVELNATICYVQDETKINSVESSKIELKPNFWRAYFYSSKIEECYHLQENCLGGWYSGDKSCTFGHIGALCEQCDLYNVRGDGSFSTSSPYKCGSCDQIEENIISILLISLWTLVSILMSVNGTIETINQFIGGEKLVIFGIRKILKEPTAAVHIKVLTNYLQIIKTISTFQLVVPSILSQIFNSVGNPIEQIAYSLDCFLVSLSDINIIYFRIIWSLIMAVSYISSFFLILLIGIALKKIKYNLSMITTALIYVFIFLQPNIIQALISLISFRSISDQIWIQGNVAYRYDTVSHKIWKLSFCLPLLLIFCLLVPIFMFYGVYRNKDKLHKIKIRESWGYLYNEYKLQAYYWEFIKIFQKEFIIIFLAYYEDYIAIKASLVFLVIFAYSYLTTSISPYMTGELNRLDIQSTTVCAISIILGSSIYTAQNLNFIEIVYPFYIIIALINSLFIINMIYKIFQDYFFQFYIQIDKLKEFIQSKFSNYMKNHPTVQKQLESRQIKLQRIKSRYAILRKFLIREAQKVIKLKKMKINEGQNDLQMDENTQTNDIIQTSNFIDENTQTIDITNTKQNPKAFLYKPEEKIFKEVESQIQSAKQF